VLPQLSLTAWPVGGGAAGCLGVVSFVAAACLCSQRKLYFPLAFVLPT